MFRRAISFSRNSIRLISMEIPAKKPSLEKKIGTHNGTFHCDEVLACFLLKQLPEYKDAEIVRTRDPKILETCDVVVDVGGVFDPAVHRYDHHQRTFSENYNSLRPHMKWMTKLSSAGLVYVHFGDRVIGEIIKRKPNDTMTKILLEKVYENFIEEIDAIDNGISQTEEKPRYRVSTNLSSRVAGFNPRWNEEDKDEMPRFHKAMKLVGDEFLDRINYYVDSWWPARELVQEAINKRHEIDPSGEIMKLETGGCPWKDHLKTLEEEMKLDPLIKFVLYSDTNGKWRVQAVPVEPSSFENRVSLLEEWQGIRDEELSKLSGIPDCIFVHASGFIGGNATYEGALKMAQMTLAARK